jgi:hypothetical protein
MGHHGVNALHASCASKPSEFRCDFGPPKIQVTPYARRSAAPPNHSVTHVCRPEVGTETTYQFSRQLFEKPVRVQNALRNFAGGSLGISLCANHPPTLRPQNRSIVTISGDPRVRAHGKKQWRTASESTVYSKKD